MSKKLKFLKILICLLCILNLVLLISYCSRSAINERITPIKIINDMSKDHPRLMATEEDFERIKVMVKTDYYMREWYRNLTVEANKLLTEPVVNYEIPDDVRLLETSRKVLERTINLSLMYRLTGNEVYAERAWKELSIVSNPIYFPDWNPKHFLDTAEMTTAVAIGYDWLYDYFSAQQKEKLRKSIINNGLSPALEVYKGTANRDEISLSWRDTTDNWNTVSNSGMIIGALAVGSESPETKDLTGEILYYALQSIQKSLSEYAPDGGFPEGPNYWNYATLYLAYLFSSMDTALGTDYGLSLSKGLSETGYFPIYLTGTNGTFNVGDSGIRPFSSIPQLFWFANKYNKPTLAEFALDKYSPMNLIWYRSQHKEGIEEDNIPLDKHFEGSKTGIVTMRSSWDDPNSIFVGIHGGDNQAYHGDLDVGSFVLDALGERWVYELGADNYNLPGYFQRSSQRWTYYRKRVEGNNTIVINPDAGPDQNIYAVSKITSFKTNHSEAYTTIDMTSAYKNDAYSVKRGLGLINNRTMVQLQDELRLKKSSIVYWFMHTEADISLSDDKKTATLTRFGKKMYIQLTSPENGEFSIMPDKPLMREIDPNYESNNKDMKKLSIILNNVKNTTISVTFIPVPNGLDLIE